MFKSFINSSKKQKSTGIEGLDILLNEGINLGDILLLEQNEDVKYHLGIHRIFLSQGLEENDKVVHISLDNPVLSPPESISETTDGIKVSSTSPIAWRYNRMLHTKNTSEVKGTGTISDARKYNFKKEHKKTDEIVSIPVTTTEEILKRLSKEVDSTTRVSISSLFSPLWNLSQKEIDTFLYELRRIIRCSSAICLVSIPTYFHPEFTYQYFDRIISLETNPISTLKYDGIIECIKTVPLVQHKHAILCNSAGIKIEKIILPPT
ncbi:elongator complex protein 4 [Nematocida sp. AWRm80]|nr:elongator complex protein 4 [Nematocida sp. AWRm80]